MRTEYLRSIVKLALAEDMGAGDITTDQLVPVEAKSRARLMANADGVVCGVDVAREVFRTLDPGVGFRKILKDGQRVRRHEIIAEIRGRSRALLSAERVALNLLSILSGIATKTRLFVDKIKPYKTQIMDTRKTTPLLRQLERYAVATGGGFNHRFNLNDMAMIKDNHRICCKGRSISEAVDALKIKTRALIEVEVDNLVQLREILGSKADIILLDNMSPRQVAAAVKLCRQARSGVLLEASGGITLNNVRQYSAAGVDRISIGALTHSHQALDISMEFTPVP